ncbi:MAG: VCBS repeat-containing protein [Saprospiraceae bacterium]|nr:VCBS repeat-containing protein [Saprospiraceae bacterium]
MTKPLRLAAATALVSLLFFSCKKEDATSAPSNAQADGPVLFNLLPPEKTGVTFVNQLDEGPNTNILMYEYFYNGGGVATGDFNNDGWLDLYFTSNMGDCKLYLNEGKGGLTFRDATGMSGASGRPGPWKTGVNVVDINGDGKLDIYLCYSGALPDEKRKNQLFINTTPTPPSGGRGAGATFQERAAEFGLDSPGHSNQSYFLDYDRDGDLDMLLLQHNPKNLPMLNEAQTAAQLKASSPAMGLRLFRQDNGKFSDVTEKTGLNCSELSYGLGLAISDLNADGWPDFYVSNDYNVPDYLYLNNQNGTFLNALSDGINHTSQFSMGNDVADLNHDGLPDLITLDMLPEDNARQKLLLAPDNYGKFDLNVRSGFYYQFMRNMLQLNNGDGTFSEVGQLAGISNTDWSWSALAADYDNDGQRDLYITNGYHRDYTNLDFIAYMDDFVQKKGRLQREDVLEIIKNMPASNVTNYLFRGNGELHFDNITNACGMGQPSNSNGAVYADLDKDGDLDLIVNNINKPAFIYENIVDKKAGNHLQLTLKGEGMNTQGIGAKVSVFADKKQFFAEQNPARGYLSAVSPILQFGLGNLSAIDSLIITWPSGKQEKQTDITINSNLILEERNAQLAKPIKAKYTPLFTPIKSPIDYTNPPTASRDFDRQKLLIGELSTHGPCMAKGDLNGDGLEDIFIGGAAGQAASVYFQGKNGQFTKANIPAFEADKASEDADAALFDADGDGDLDIYVASGGYHQFQPDDAALQDRLYLNDGKSVFTKNTNALPKMTASKGCVAVGDVNGDGHPDLFVGGWVVPGRYPEAPASYLLVNDGKGNFTDQTKALAPELAQPGMVCDAAWVDLNQDGKQDLVTVGEWMPMAAYLNEGGKLRPATEQVFGKAYNGLWSCIEVADLNKDGRPDFIVGNLGTNTQIKATDSEPAELYYADFDENGAVDPILCTYIQGKSYPYLTRDELVQQLPKFKKRFTDFKRYAGVSTEELFSEGELKKANRLTVNYLETMLFLSDINGKYRLGQLPVQAQFAPVHCIAVVDADKDGQEDLLLLGNDRHLKLRLGMADANHGVLLRGDGKGQFRYLPQAQSGLQVRADVRCVAQLGNVVFMGVNGQNMQAFRFDTNKSR